MSRKQVPETNAQVTNSQVPNAQVPNAQVPDFDALVRYLVASLSGKGGVGKSYLIMLLALAFREIGRDPVVVSLDRNHGAAALQGDFQFCEQTMPKLEEVTEDPYAIQRRFSGLRPLAIDNPDKDLMWDFGSEASTHFPEYAYHTQLSDFLRAQRVRPVFTIPYTPHPNVTSSALQMARALHELFDEPRIVGVEMRRRGAGLPGAPDGNALAARTEFERIGRHVLLAPLPSGTELLLENGLRLDQALDLETSKLSRILGEPDDLAEMLRGFLRVWLRKHLRLLVDAVTG